MSVDEKNTGIHLCSKIAKNRMIITYKKLDKN